MLGMRRRSVHCDHIPVELLDLRDGHEVRRRERLDVVHRLFVRLLLGVYQTGGVLELPYVRRRKISDSRMHYNGRQGVR